jgi:hypothetical protein
MTAAMSKATKVKEVGCIFMLLRWDLWKVLRIFFRQAETINADDTIVVE